MRHGVKLCSLILFVFAGSALRAADEPKPVEGALLLGKHTYKLAHIVAYEAKVFDEPMITILASDRKLDIQKIKEALRKGDGTDDNLSLVQPHVKVSFDKEGKASMCSGWADNASFSTSGSALSGEMKLDGGKVIGKAKLETQGEGQLKRNFEIAFHVVLGTDAPQKAAPRPTEPAKPTVSGKFQGNGKPAKLAFVSARSREPFADKPAIQLVFTEKDHSKAKDPGIKAGFGEFGSALIISLHEDGGIFGCQVSHAAHSKRGFSSVGSIKSPEFEVGEDRITGQITTDGEQEFFGDTWDVDIKFTVPWTPPMAKPVATTTPPAKTTEKPKDKGESDKPKAEAAARLEVRKLALPKDASDIEYRTLVEQMVFKSAGDVKAVVSEFSKNLEAQGWKAEEGDLVTPKSAILNRTREKATLTIFVKPATKGSEITIMTTGLKWDGKEADDEETEEDDDE